MSTPFPEHAEQRREQFLRILKSNHPRRIVVAGPGTGKSYLFQQAIAEEQTQGKSKFLAVTFIGKLGDALADELAGAANTTTLHGLARKLVLDRYGKGWHYYPSMKALIDEDLSVRGIAEQVNGVNYLERSRYYKGVGDADVVWHAVQLCRGDPKNIPIQDLILVDEFQDFNDAEAELVDLLASKNKMLVVGDDDQALYEFKGSSPRFIRERHHSSNADWESHTLQFCSRCTDVIVRAFHAIVEHFKLNEMHAERIKKDYVCFHSSTDSGGKRKDSELNPKILVARNVKPGGIAYFVQKELKRLLERQKIKTCLVIGEARTCQRLLEDAAKSLKARGFKYVDHRAVETKAFEFHGDVVAGYRVLARGDNDALGWRILALRLPREERARIIGENYVNAEAFLAALPAEFVRTHGKNANTFRKLLELPPSGRRDIADSTIESLKQQIVAGNRTEREILIDQLVSENNMLPRPLNSIEITVTNILGSKGLGADVVFLVGFDQGRLPAKQQVEGSEIYQMLVALTRAKKRLYLLNTVGLEISNFIDGIPAALWEPVE